MHILFIDNLDSFSFNLVDDLRRRGAAVDVRRNDIAATAALERALAMPAPRAIVLSPGPGAPADAGCCIELIRLAAGRIPVIGVCLGHQAIVEAFGGRVGRAPEVVHGKPARIEHDGSGLFKSLPSPMSVGRYHSLVALELPPELRITARFGELIMGVAHREHPIVGLQFHPESILTPDGGRLFDRIASGALS